MNSQNEKRTGSGLKKRRPSLPRKHLDCDTRYAFGKSIRKIAVQVFEGMLRDVREKGTRMRGRGRGATK